MKSCVRYLCRASARLQSGGARRADKKDSKCPEEICRNGSKSRDFSRRSPAYTVEFPEPSRVLALKGAQLLLVPSVWSLPALNRWQIQLPARALDNTVFVAGINNVGEGACGHSKVVQPDGAVLTEASEDKEEVLLCEIDFDKISEVRDRIPYLKEYDQKLAPQA